MDIDIDLPDREKVLELIKHTPAAILRNGEWTKHNSGVFVTEVPSDPVTGLCSLDYKEAENLGYVKLDLLNVSVYSQVKNQAHLDKLMSTEPMWEMLNYRDFVQQVVHINKHFNTIQKMPEPINSVVRMAMLLAIIRPAKKHLIGKSWKEVAKEVWLKTDDSGYAFKRAHAVSYAHLVKIHMNLLCGVD